MPMVVIAGLIIGAGIMALSTRTFAGLIGSIRQGQSRQAQEAAEAGLATILKELNRNYGYLLSSDCEVGPTYEPASDCTGWKLRAASSSRRCSSSLSDISGMLNVISAPIAGNRGRYQLIDYRFNGDWQQGGTATIRVLGEGQVNPDGSTQNRSKAVVEQTLSILPKSCNVPVNGVIDRNGFAGLLGETVTLANNDVLGAVSGNVYCTSCDPNSGVSLSSQIGVLKNGTVNGQIYGGNISIPPPPQFPPPPAGTTITPLKIDGSTTIVAGDTNGGACFVDTQKVTHCQVSRINLSGQAKLSIYSSGTLPDGTVVPQGKGIRLYFDKTDEQAKEEYRSTNQYISCYNNQLSLGDPNPQATCDLKGIINIGGQTSIAHTGRSPGDLALFGLPRSTSSVPSQSVVLGGGSVTANMFVYFPDGSVGINGGSANPDIKGAVWSRSFGGSSSNNAEVLVPANMGAILAGVLDPSYALGARDDFAALGASRWQIYQVPSL